MSKLHIYTLSWNGSDKLSLLKDSLMPNLDNVDYSWTIKDNKSTDDTIEKIKSWDNPNIRCIPYKNNLQNFAAGMNFLFNETQPNDNDYILLLNNDVIFKDNISIKNMMNIINKDSGVGCVGARLLFTNSDKIQHAGVVFDGRYKLPMHFRAKEASSKDDKKNRQFQAVTAAVLLTKAEYYKNAFTQNKSGNKGMDENYIWSFEDTDFCLSIKYNLQKKIIYCGETDIFHEESASLKKNPSNHLFMNHNVNYLKSKWLSKYQLDKDYYIQNPNYNLYTE